MLLIRTGSNLSFPKLTKVSVESHFFISGCINIHMFSSWKEKALFRFFFLILRSRGIKINLQTEHY